MVEGVQHKGRAGAGVVLQVVGGALQGCEGAGVQSLGRRLL